jgi:hypothetical protein
MSGLRQQIDGYLAVRRSLGFRMARPEKLLAQSAGYLEQAGAGTVTTEHALAWAVLPGGHPSWHAYRLAVARGFAAWLRTVDPAAEIPPAGLIPARKPRATPYLDAGVLIVRDGKHGKSRLVPVHDTAARALRDYLRTRDMLCPDATADAVLISPAGTRLIYCNVHASGRFALIRLKLRISKDREVAASRHVNTPNADKTVTSGSGTSYTKSVDANAREGFAGVIAGHCPPAGPPLVDTGQTPGKIVL